MDIGQTQFLTKTINQATISGHVWPIMAACEAGLESRWGRSQLAIQAHNLFGTKTYKSSIYPTLSLPTREYVNGKYVRIPAEWVIYPSLIECFQDRMNTLRRLSMYYGTALSASNAIDYINEVSKHWSTDPKRADKVIAIYQEYDELGRI